MSDYNNQTDFENLAQKLDALDKRFSEHTNNGVDSQRISFLNLLDTDPRINTITTSATPTPNIESTDILDITALASAAAFGKPLGSPSNGQKLIIRIKDNGTARALTWNANYTPHGAALPSTTVLSKYLTIGFIYNTMNGLNKWCCLAVGQET